MAENKTLLAYRLQFFAKDGPGGEKTEEPTQKKIEDSRKEGQVAKSKEVASTLTLIALFIMLKVWISTLGRQLLELFPGYYDRMAEYVTMEGGQISTRTFSSLTSYALQRIAVIILPFLLVGFIICFVADLAQVKWKPTTKPLQPKFNKLNPASGVKKLFSLQSLVELLKSIIKIAIIIIVIYN
ncbi:MAG: EscU/YscU/HrcU family type III secretion system export apparatus switch protein, partial [Lachnospiraceae bacterium]|nr:EscU/YscU/HrcU family type III secretion system export apparatus switch protein [Lachnospiraceae bacterium]